MSPAVGLYAANPRVESPSSARMICERYTSRWRTWLMLGSEQSRPSTGSGSSFSASMALSALRTVILGDQKVFIGAQCQCRDAVHRTEVHAPGFVRRCLASPGLCLQPLSRLSLRSPPVAPSPRTCDRLPRGVHIRV